MTQNTETKVTVKKTRSVGKSEAKTEVVKVEAKKYPAKKAPVKKAPTKRPKKSMEAEPVQVAAPEPEVVKTIIPPAVDSADMIKLRKAMLNVPTFPKGYKAKKADKIYVGMAKVRRYKKETAAILRAAR